MMAQSRCDIAFRGILVNEMCKILLILTGAIQMINVTAIEPESGTKILLPFSVFVTSV